MGSLGGMSRQPGGSVSVVASRWVSVVFAEALSPGCDLTVLCPLCCQGGGEEPTEQAEAVTQLWPHWGLRGCRGRPAGGPRVCLRAACCCCPLGRLQAASPAGDSDIQAVPDGLSSCMGLFQPGRPSQTYPGDLPLTLPGGGGPLRVSPPAQAPHCRPIRLAWPLPVL